MDLSVFTEKNDKKHGKGSGMFDYKNLTSFEKVLFLQHNVNELVDLLKRKNTHIQDLENQLGRSIENYDESVTIVNLKAEITKLQGVVKGWKDLYFELKENKDV